jgi:hypothetical protein
VSDVHEAGAERIALPNRITDWSRLKIIDDVIHYRLYGQDGSIRSMTCADNVENRNFVSWVQIHDRYAGATMIPPLDQDRGHPLP